MVNYVYICTYMYTYICIMEFNLTEAKEKSETCVNCNLVLMCLEMLFSWDKDEASYKIYIYIYIYISYNM